MSRLNLVRRNDAPLPPYDCEMVQCDVPFVPFILGALWQRSQKYWWAQAEDQQLGRWGMNKQMMEVLMPCGKDIVDALNRLYMQNDQAYFAREYDYEGSGTPEDPYVLTTEIPFAPPHLRGGSGQGMFESQHATRDWVEGMASGFPNDYNADIRNVRQQLEDILAAIGSGTFDPAAIEALLAEVVVALG